MLQLPMTLWFISGLARSPMALQPVAQRQTPFTRRSGFVYHYYPVSRRLQVGWWSNAQACAYELRMRSLQQCITTRGHTIFSGTFSCKGNKESNCVRSAFCFCFCFCILHSVCEPAGCLSRRETLCLFARLPDALP